MIKDHRLKTVANTGRLKTGHREADCRLMRTEDRPRSRAASNSPSRDVPQVQDGRVAEHIWCARCGYDLYSLEAEAPCPECAAIGAYDRHWKGRRALRRWAGVTVVAATASLAVALGFRMVLWTQGLSVGDLWGSGRIRPLNSRAIPYPAIGLRTVEAALWTSPITWLLIIGTFCFALRYRDRFSAKLGLCAGLAALLSMWLTVESCANLGGL